jgi:hypothetical protein
MEEEEEFDALGANFKERGTVSDEQLEILSRLGRREAGVRRPVPSLPRGGLFAEAAAAAAHLHLGRR